MRPCRAEPAGDGGHADGHGWWRPGRVRPGAPGVQAFGKNIRLCGPVGAGQVVKLINQLLVGIIRRRLPRRLCLARGLAPIRRLFWI